MKTTARFLFIVASCMGLISCEKHPPAPPPVTPRPLSHEAELIEITSSSEWLVRATGYAVGTHGDRELEATYDARCAAVYFVLMGGTDPLLQIPDERRRFESVAAQLYSADEITKYISWESTKFIVRAEIDDGRRLKIVKDFKVNRQLLRDYLVAANVVQPVDKVTLGFPTIMVIPAVEPGEDPIAALSDPLISHIAGAIESHLTAQGFDVLIPTQKVMVDEVIDASRTLREIYGDDQRALALAFGSDIYFTFSILWDHGSAAGTDVRKASAVIRAFESTTSRSLGTETGYSRPRPAAEEAVAEEAVNDAVPKILSRAEKYWKEDRYLGFQYLAHLSFAESLPRETVQNLQNELAVGFRGSEGIKHFKEEIATEKSCDYRMWCDPELIASPRELAVEIQRLTRQALPSATVRMPILTRKLAVLDIS